MRSLAMLKTMILTMLTVIVLAATPVWAAAKPNLVLIMMDDLDAPSALASIDHWAASEGDDARAPGLVRDLVDAALGLRL